MRSAVHSPPALLSDSIAFTSSNTLVQASAVPPANAPEFDFLDTQPWLVPYALPNNMQALRNMHTVGGGYCGWGSLGLARDGDQRQAVHIRAQVVAYVQQYASNVQGLVDIC